MMDQRIQGKTKDEWVKEFPLLDPLMKTEEVFWINPNHAIKDEKLLPFGQKEIDDADERLRRFASFILKAFPITETMNGFIESPLIAIPQIQQFFEEWYGAKIPGKMLLKEDNLLPIAGSIKARGGFYEVLKHSEELAVNNGLLTIHEDFSVFNTSKFRKFFSQYSISVGSTGNLGLSIGMMSAKLGYQVIVHMSSNAKQWKKDLLRSQGVQVIEYDSDYSRAVKEGRKAAQEDPNCHFVDDENSQDLFLGYAVAAKRLKRQLDEMKIEVNPEHPLFVYLPCGVGGGPGGITFGLKQVFGDSVHCFFAEPTHSPCMLLGLLTGLHNQVSVRDFGIDNRTEADGLAVGRPSPFVSKIMENRVSGVYTVQDDELYILLSALGEFEHVLLEPSSLAGMPGPARLLQTKPGRDYLSIHRLTEKMSEATHIVWATGGSLVPEDIMEEYNQKGQRLTRQYRKLRGIMNGL